MFLVMDDSHWVVRLAEPVGELVWVKRQINADSADKRGYGEPYWHSEYGRPELVSVGRLAYANGRRFAPHCVPQP